MRYINLDGKMLPANEALIPADNSAFRYGYGLFETMLVTNGVINLENYHWERLFSGMQVLQLQKPALMTAHWLREQVLRTVKKNDLEKLCRVRLQMFGGSGGIFELADNPPGFVIECFPLQPEAIQLNENGLVLGLAHGLGKPVNDLAQVKSCNALIYALAAAQAKTNKWNDALVSNTAGNIIESTIANIFWIKSGIVFTPPLSDGCIAGAMRRHIMSTIPVQEKSLTEKELLLADEVFLTNSIRRMKWVGSIENASFGKNLTEKIYHTCFGNT